MFPLFKLWPNFPLYTRFFTFFHFRPKFFRFCHFPPGFSRIFQFSLFCHFNIFSFFDRFSKISHIVTYFSTFQTFTKFFHFPPGFSDFSTFQQLFTQFSSVPFFAVSIFFYFLTDFPVSQIFPLFKLLQIFSTVHQVFQIFPLSTKFFHNFPFSLFLPFQYF